MTATRNWVRPALPSRGAFEHIHRGAYQALHIPRVDSLSASSRHASRLVRNAFTRTCMWPCYKYGCISANDYFAAMSGVMESAAVVEPRCAALRVARNRNCFGYRQGRTA